MIMVVDDMIFNRMLIKEILKDYDILEAEDGQDAVDKMSDDISLILMDINMPRMDGIIASGIIKDKYPDVYIIGVSAYPVDGKDISVFDKYMQKPINSQLLSMYVNSVVN